MIDKLKLMKLAYLLKLGFKEKDFAKLDTSVKQFINNKAKEYNDLKKKYAETKAPETYLCGQYLTEDEIRLWLEHSENKPWTVIAFCLHIPISKDLFKELLDKYNNEEKIKMFIQKDLTILKDKKRLRAAADGCSDAIPYYWIKLSDFSYDKELLDMIINGIAENGQVRDYFFVVNDAKVEGKYADLTKKLIKENEEVIDQIYLHALLNDFKKVNNLMKRIIGAEQ